MAMYEYITNEGYNLLQRMLMGEVTIDFTRVEMGDGYSLEADLRKVTALTNVVVSLDVDSVVKQENKTISISALFTNEKLEKGFYFREKGIYAKGLDGSGTEQEVLFSYANARDTANYIDPPTVELVEKKIISHCTQCQQTDEDINIVVKSGIYVTRDEFDGLANDALIQFEQSEGLQELESGSALKILIARTAKAVSSFISHLKDSDERFENQMQEISEVRDIAETATNIAKGRNQAHVFKTTEAMQIWLSNADNKGKYNVGDNLYILDVGVPDWWVSEVLEDADAETGYYYKIAQLETQKVDLTNIESDISKLQDDVSGLNSNLENKQSKMMYTTTEISGTGYGFAYLPVPSGYFLVSAFLWSTTTMGIVNINKTNDTTYTLVFNENTSTNVTYAIECVWTKID